MASKFNNGVQDISAAQVLTKAFRQEGETVSDFMGQLKKLTPEAKEELAVDAAKYLGYTVTPVTA